MQFSVIIPTLNEGNRIGTLVESLFDIRPDLEVIVVDGGSVDETIIEARKSGAKVISSQRGRGTQCNTGARHAGGDVFIFLHADTFLPKDAFTLVDDLFRVTENKFGKFRLRFIPKTFLLDLLWFFTRFDSIITSFGDQCIVIKRDFFKKINGFPDWPLFEDVCIFQKARKYTKVHSLPCTVFTSSRRFNKKGAIRQLVWNAWLILLYLYGWSPYKLEKMYNQL